MSPITATPLEVRRRGTFDSAYQTSLSPKGRKVLREIFSDMEEEDENLRNSPVRPAAIDANSPDGTTSEELVALYLARCHALEISPSNHFIHLLTQGSPTNLVLSEQQLDDGALAAIFSLLPHMTVLKRLSLDGLQLGDYAIESLAIAVSSPLSHLEIITLRSANLTDARALHLLQALTQAPQLRQLDISCNPITERCGEGLGQLLRLAPFLRTLMCDFCPLSTVGAIALASGLPYASSLTSLYMGHCSLGDEGIMALTNALKASQSEVPIPLVQLHLWSNHLTDSGGEHIAQILPVLSRTLRSLNLSGNALGPSSAGAIVAAIGSHAPSLVSLSLSRNPLGDEGAIAVATGLLEVIQPASMQSAAPIEGLSSHLPITSTHALTLAASLRELHLSHCHFTAHSGSVLARAMRSHPSLASLDLSHNFLDNDGWVGLLTCLHASSTQLTHLSAAHTGMGMPALLALASALKSSSCRLKSLQLSSNALGDDGARLLASALTSNDPERGITHLWIDHNDMSDAGMVALVTAELRTLSHLSAASNNLGRVSAVSLGDFISSGTTSMKSLCLDGNQIPNASLRELAVICRNHAVRISGDSIDGWIN
jgi:Ran GTPase-activating protein (RanGAP) involved in mRNA processing and transport